MQTMLHCLVDSLEGKRCNHRAKFKHAPRRESTAEASQAAHDSKPSHANRGRLQATLWLSTSTLTLSPSQSHTGSGASSQGSEQSK